MKDHWKSYNNEIRVGLKIKIIRAHCKIVKNTEKGPRLVKIKIVITTFKKVTLSFTMTFMFLEKA